MKFFYKLILLFSLIISGYSYVSFGRMAQVWDNIEKFENYIRELYNQCELYDTLKYKVFRYAVIGYINLDRHLTNKRVITIIDYTQPSSAKRNYVIDLKSGKLLYNTLVAHGENTGDDFSKYFSNENNSRKSSIGFYVTGKTYNGRYGYSMRLNGMEPCNNNAKKRAIVIHGAAYVSSEHIKKNGMLGRSGGCPALPLGESRSIINTTKNSSCLYIYYDDEAYLNSSKYLNADSALIKYIKQCK